MPPLFPPYTKTVSAMNKQELIELCNRFDLPNEGLVINLRTRLRAYLQDHQEELRENPQFARLYPRQRGQRPQESPPPEEQNPRLDNPNEHEDNEMNGPEDGEMNEPEHEANSQRNSRTVSAHSDFSSFHGLDRSITQGSVSDLDNPCPNSFSPPPRQDSIREDTPSGTYPHQILFSFIPHPAIPHTKFL